MDLRTNHKIVSIEELRSRTLPLPSLDDLLKSQDTNYVLENMEKRGVVLTNGIFDVLHLGHIYSLDYARSQGDQLFVLVNSDKSTKELKGENRPFQDEQTRMAAVAALECVDYVARLDDTRITSALRKIRPRLWLKGGTYTLETLDQDERKTAEAYGVSIDFIPMLEGYSSTKILEQGMQNTKE